MTRPTVANISYIETLEKLAREVTSFRAGLPTSSNAKVSDVSAGDLERVMILLESSVRLFSEGPQWLDVKPSSQIAPVPDGPAQQLIWATDVVSSLITSMKNLHNQNEKISEILLGIATMSELTASLNLNSNETDMSRHDMTPKELKPTRTGKGKVKTHVHPPESTDKPFHTVSLTKRRALKTPTVSRLRGLKLKR